MTDKAPRQVTQRARVGAVAGGSDAAAEVVAEAPFDGTVTEVTYTPDAAQSGADTNSRDLQLINRGQSGSGTTVVASLSLTNGVNLVAGDEKTITLSVVAGATTVAAGDILAFKSTHVGTGIADPGGLVQVVLNQS